MEWLVVQSTTKVRFKGKATINGEGLYTFKVTAEDNGEPGTSDWFKIEIWMAPDVDTERLTAEGLDAYCEIGALTYDGYVVLGVDIAHLAPVSEPNSP